MTQTLVLESAWEKQVSPQDRQLIERCFMETKDNTESSLSFTYLRHDYNHQQSLLVMVLMHNYKKVEVQCIDQLIDCYDLEGHKLATKSFSLPYEIPAKTSMPWTFIFPKGTYEPTNKETELSLSFGNKEV